jgi:hypothetical protein
MGRKGTEKRKEEQIKRNEKNKKTEKKREGTMDIS